MTDILDIGRSLALETGDGFEGETIDRLCDEIEKLRGWNKEMVEKAADNSLEGYKLVPIEPTERMIDAGADSMSWQNYCDDAKRAYKAMLSAAPEV